MSKQTVKVYAHVPKCPMHGFEHYVLMSCDDTPEAINDAKAIIKQDYKDYTCKLDVEPIVRRTNEA